MTKPRCPLLQLVSRLSRRFACEVIHGFYGLPLLYVFLLFVPKEVIRDGSCTFGSSWCTFPQVGAQNVAMADSGGHMPDVVDTLDVGNVCA
jgi:hypothetical protein